MRRGLTHYIVSSSLESEGAFRILYLPRAGIRRRGVRTGQGGAHIKLDLDHANVVRGVCVDVHDRITRNRATVGRTGDSDRRRRVVDRYRNRRRSGA